jgi:DNA-binding NtrC family response regulator
MGETDSASVASDRPLAFVIDDDTRICQFVAETLVEHGIDVATYQTAKPALAAIEQRPPMVVFCDVALLQSDAIDVLRGLGALHYGGVVQLMSGGNPSLLQAVQRIGVRAGVKVGLPLRKPVTREAIVNVLASLGMPTQAMRPNGAAAHGAPPVVGA